MWIATGLLQAQTANRPGTARGEWPTYGGDLGSSKYSPLDQINKDNFVLKVTVPVAHGVATAEWKEFSGTDLEPR